jgi:hypothetical protein
MKIIRFIPAPDGGSQFVEADIPIDNASTDAFGHLIRRSATVTAQSAMFTEMPEGLDQNWHPASRRQLVVVLSGTVEVEATDGTKTGGATAKCSSPTMSAAAAIVPARSAGQRGCCSCICRPKPI